MIVKANITATYLSCLTQMRNMAQGDQKRNPPTPRPLETADPSRESGSKG